MISLEIIKDSASKLAEELCAAARLGAGAYVIVGCSSSEVAGHNVGSASSPEIGCAVFDALYEVFDANNIFLAAQCCEHLNRAVIIERKAIHNSVIVNAVPTPKAGGSFAAAAYNRFNDPVAIEEIQADAGLDIGGTLIGMHLKRVAIPLRLGITGIGYASVNAARTRPKLIGGARAVYDDKIL